MTRWLLPAGLLMAAFAIFFASRGEDARAAGPCGTTHDAVDAEEQQFLTLLHSWRVSSGVSSEPMELSGALNQAAAWFAEYQVTSNGLGSHVDSAGRTWAQRAIDCGYTAKTTTGIYWATASGEGIHGASTGGSAVGPQQALAGMIGQGVGHSGIYMSNFPAFPAKCYGVAVRRSGEKVAWVVVIAALPAAMPCPGGAGGGGAPPTVPSSPTSSPTSTSPTPTSTPTATPTPAVFRSWFSLLSRD